MQTDWIWPASGGERNVYARFEDDFSADTGDIYADISTTGEYVLFINGNLAGFGQYADWKELRTVNRHNITAYCQAGSNHFLLRVWHPGLDTSVGVAAAPGARFEVSQSNHTLLQSHPGSHCALETGYKMGDVPLITGQLGYSFFYDSTQPLPPMEPAATALIHCNLQARPTSYLQLDPQIKGVLCKAGSYHEVDRDAEPAIRMQNSVLHAAPSDSYSDESGWIHTRNGEGLFLVFDLGREFSGYLTFEADFSQDETILIGYGEHLLDGRVRSAIQGRGFCATYRGKAGPQHYTHWFRRWGCRYLQVHVPSGRIRLGSFGLLPVMYSVPQHTAFTCQDTVHQRIYDVAVRTLHLCMHEHYEDCPWREQALYTMDSREQILCGYYAFRETKMPLASIKLLASGMQEDGLLSLCAPAKVAVTIPAFSAVLPIQAWEYYLYTGDAQGIAPILPIILQILDTFRHHQDAQGCILRFPQEHHWNFYEWRLGLDGGSLAAHTKTSRPECILTAWVALALQATIQLVQHLGDTSLLPSLQEQYHFTTASLESFWCEETQLYAAFLEEGTPPLFAELTQAMVLLTGACPPERAAHLRERLALREGLVQVTLNDELLRFMAMLQDEPRYVNQVFDEIRETWGSMLEKGATSFWETIEGAEAFGDAGSLCHGWSAIPVYFFFAYGKGLRPTAPGVMGTHPIIQNRIF